MAGSFNTVNGVTKHKIANNISGGIGVNGMLTVQQLKLTHDDTKLLVVHTGLVPSTPRTNTPRISSGEI